MQRLPSRLLFIADAAHSDDLPGLVREAAAAGVRFVEIRRVAAPPVSSGRRLAEIEAVRQGAPAVTLLVNDRVDLALLADADGAHVGQDDLPADAARALLGTSRLLGVSTHDRAQLVAAQDLPVDYVALGPIFASRTKCGHAEPIGLQRLAELRAACRKPLVAIGGIEAANARAVLEAGADCVAVASAISMGDVASQAAEMLRAVGEVRAVRGWALAGFSGSGKSTAGRLLAEAAGRRFVDLDAFLGEERVLELLARGEEALRAAEADALRRLGALSPPEGLVVALGGGAMEGDASRSVLARWFDVAWLDAPPEICAARCAAQTGRRRPLLERALASGAGAIEKLHLSRTKAARHAMLRVDAGHPAHEVARILLSRLQAPESGP